MEPQLSLRRPQPDEMDTLGNGKRGRYPRRYMIDAAIASSKKPCLWAIASPGAEIFFGGNCLSPKGVFRVEHATQPRDA
ncbi:MAG: hypothetical protein LBD04_10535 [Synergistaceae bacterium]|jgi:hypothetical protein|nr:hypothetical protein [Synergistaceae bacterium]